MLNSDLALEAKEMYEENAGEITEINGVFTKEETTKPTRETTATRSA